MEHSVENIVLPSPGKSDAVGIESLDLMLNKLTSISSKYKYLNYRVCAIKAIGHPQY